MRTDDDRRHEPTDDPWWAEIWEFEFAVPDATMAMFTRLAVYPNLGPIGQTWFWAAVVRKGRPYVLCRDQEIAAPNPAWPLEIRGGSLWSHAICETPFDHWTVAMEAFAVGFDDPMEAWRAERGDKVGLALILSGNAPMSSPNLVVTASRVTRWTARSAVSCKLTVRKPRSTLREVVCTHGVWLTQPN
jgi:hypothetical protein